MQYGVRLPGAVVTDLAWTCVADVMAAHHGLGLTQAQGTLVVRDQPGAAWRVLHEQVTR